MVLSLCLGLTTPTFAVTTADNTSDSFESIASTLTDSDSISAFLDNNETTQTVEISERDMLSENIITRDDLNSELLDLSTHSEYDLQKLGYNSRQIETIKSYKAGSDAFSHIFSPTSTYANNTRLVFRYGLAGNNTRKTVLIAYDMQWTEKPTYTYPDSFAIGWLAADSNSHRVLTKIDSCVASVQYKYNDGTPITDGSGNKKTVDLVQNQAAYVTGSFPLKYDYKGDKYGQQISGCTQISTQSDSYNISTVQLFVCYAHSVASLSLDSVTISVKATEINVTFDLNHKKEQVKLVDTSHTFAYNDQDVIVEIGYSN